jgi:alginate O-acetyltransferase complex protein AlgJ
MLGLTSELVEDDLPLVPRMPRRARVIEPASPDAHLMEARVVTEQRDASRPRAVVFRDSFGSALIPFLSEHFARALYLWQYNFDPEVVLAERPTVVIQEWVGRRLSTMLPYDPFAPQ